MAVTVLVLVLALSAISHSSSLDPVAAGETAALLAFKRSISADPSALLSGWDPAVQRHCEWRGVTCDAGSGRVIGLNLTGSRSSPLAGALAVSIGNLTELRVLSLRHNAFSGEIPAAAVGALLHLEVLDLRYNNFSGKIPDEISYLLFLRVLDLAYNSLSGPIPENLIGFSRLEFVDLSFNQLSGEIRISPFNLCQFLTHLKLSSNFLVDKIPPEIGKCSNLQTLSLDRNILEDRIPADIGHITNLRLLDVSRNSLTQSIPRELGNCRKLSVFVLTNLNDFASTDSSSVVSSNIEEFNAFSGAIPPEILSIPSLEILWAPRANLRGHLPDYRNSSCNLKILNLGQNYIAGLIPEWLGMCKKLSFLDLSSNYLQGLVPVSLQVQCMVYFNVSQNLLSGSLPGLSEALCTDGLIFGSQNDSWLERENLGIAYILQNTGNAWESVLNNEFVILHDFSWNGFTGSLPTFSLPVDEKFSYGLFLNNNKFNGSLSSNLFGPCTVGSGFAVNLSVNQISGSTEMLSNCLLLKSFEADSNQFSGPITTDIGNLHLLKHLDLRRNHLNGSIPDQLGELKYMEHVLLAGNTLSGVIPVWLGGLSSISVLDLSSNSLSGNIPSSLASAANLEILLLDHNQLSGSIPPSLATLSRLTVFDVSFNNLSGSIPHFEHLDDCKFFLGNSFLQPCPDSNASSPSAVPFETDDSNRGGRESRLKPFTIAAVASASMIVLVLVVLVLVLVCRKRKFGRVKSVRRKVVVTFANAPAELTYDDVVRATGNFSIQNLIGTGGFGATYKAELVPGFLVAVKRLSIGRFQGLRQFDAEIRTLGRIRHKNLVTLIGYHMGEAETFLIYNYLSGGNLETFIQSMSSRNVHWHEIHKIAQDVAQALTYLHYSCVPRIVHRDIKPSNILLDEKLNAYLSDFGLARLLEVSETHATTDVAGTFGYVAPEYATTCRVSDKADVYSYGVVLLELMSGKRSLDPSFAEYGNGFTIVAWGRLLIQEERVDELFSPTLWEAGPKDKLVEMLRLALACTVDSISVRPSMKQVVMTLKELNRE